jgi:glycosyltransferase involved in cell wall biosynthesis
VYLTVPFVLSWSLLEAMACAAPVVASATPPVEEVATHGREALLAPFDAVDAIAEAILTLLERPGLAAELGTAARARVARDYAHETLLPRHLDLLERLRLSAAHLDPAISSGSRTSRRSIEGLQSALASSVR